MVAGLTMALRELSQLGLFWHVASPSIQTPEAHLTHSKKSTDTCKINFPLSSTVHFLVTNFVSHVHHFFNFVEEYHSLFIITSAIDSIIIHSNHTNITSWMDPYIHGVLGADVSLDLNNHMRPALQSQLLSMQKDWPDLDEDHGHHSPTHTKELPDPELLRRGKRRK
jgi:hypothetical protein